MKTLRNESLEKSINIYFENFSSQEVSTDTELGIILNAMSNMNRSEVAEGKKGSYTDVFLKIVDEVVTPEGKVKFKNQSDVDSDKFCIGNAIIYAYGITGNEKYKKAACSLAERLDVIDKLTVNDAFTALSFFMNYETTFGGKERYNEVITDYKKVAKLMDSGITSLELGMVMYSVIDAMELMAQPVFEVYMTLEKILKKAIKKAEKIYHVDTKMFGDDVEGSILITYAILKACRMKAILTEKHEKCAIAALEKAELIVLGGIGNASDFFVGAFINAYAESTRNREYQDYGRANGGELWN